MTHSMVQLRSPSTLSGIEASTALRVILSDVKEIVGVEV